MTANIICAGCTATYADSALFCPNCGRPKVRDVVGDVLLGKVLGERFQVQELIGQGGSGTIYRAEHITLRRKVAIKVLHTELSRDDLAVERFRREATTVAEIDNEHIVEIHDFGRTPDGRLYLAMELLEGETLDSILVRERTLSIERTADILIQVGEALMEAHAIGYVHRDLRPRNIYLANRRGKANFVKLLDFGLAKLVETDSQAASTSLGMTFGDPRYMSPEQARGDRIDRRADVYQLGCVAYEMLTGAPPFGGSRVFDILTKQVTEIPSPLPTRRPGVPLWMEAAAAKMLAKDPENRFATTTRMVEALRRGLETGEVMEDEVARRRESIPPPSVSRVMQKMGLSEDPARPAPPLGATHHGHTPFAPPANATQQGHSPFATTPATPPAPGSALNATQQGVSPFATPTPAPPNATQQGVSPFATPSSAPHSSPLHATHQGHAANAPAHAPSTGSATQHGHPANVPAHAPSTGSAPHTATQHGHAANVPAHAPSTGSSPHSATQHGHAASVAPHAPSTGSAPHTATQHGHAANVPTHAAPSTGSAPHAATQFGHATSGSPPTATPHGHAGASPSTGSAPHASPSTATAHGHTAGAPIHTAPAGSAPHAAPTSHAPVPLTSTQHGHASLLTKATDPTQPHPSIPASPAAAAKPDSVELLRRRTGTPRMGVPVVPAPPPPEDPSQAPVSGLIEPVPARTAAPGGDEMGISQVWYEDGDLASAHDDEPESSRVQRARKTISPSTTDMSFYDELPRRRRFGLVIGALGVLIVGGVALALGLNSGNSSSSSSSSPPPLAPEVAPPAVTIDAAPSTIIGDTTAPETPQVAPTTPPPPTTPSSTTPTPPPTTPTPPAATSVARTDATKPPIARTDAAKPSVAKTTPKSRPTTTADARDSRKPPDVGSFTPPEPTFRAPGGDAPKPPPPPEPVKVPTKDPGAGSGSQGVSGRDGPEDPYNSGDSPPAEAATPEKRAEFFANLGAQQLANGDAANAAANFKKALELDGKSTTATIGMGEIALRQGLFGDAIAHLNKAARLSPRNSRVFTLLGDSYLSLGRNNDAAANYKKALQIDPDNQRARDGYNEASSRVPPTTDE